MGDPEGVPLLDSFPGNPDFDVSTGNVDIKSVLGASPKGEKEPFFDDFGLPNDDSFLSNGDFDACSPDFAVNGETVEPLLALDFGNGLNDFFPKDEDPF